MSRFFPFFFKFSLQPNLSPEVWPACTDPALTSLSGLLQEVEQDGGCLVHAQLLCVLTTGL